MNGLQHAVPERETRLDSLPCGSHGFRNRLLVGAKRIEQPE